MSLVFAGVISFVCGFASCILLAFIIDNLPKEGGDEWKN